MYRDAICEAAEGLFADRGIEATKVEQIAREAGMSIATLYSVFDAGKAQIVRSIHGNHLGELVALATRAADDTRPADECLRDAVRGAVFFFTAHDAYLRMHLREGHAWCLPDAIAARTREGAEGFQVGVGAIIRLVERGVAENVFRTDNPRRTGKAVVMLQQLHLADWIEDEQTANPEAVFLRYWKDVEAILGIRCQADAPS
jgi:AcrR family transcriptional regulator